MGDNLVAMRGRQGLAHMVRAQSRGTWSAGSVWAPHSLDDGLRIELGHQSRPSRPQRGKVGSGSSGVFVAQLRQGFKAGRDGSGLSEGGAGSSELTLRRKRAATALPGRQAALAPSSGAALRALLSQLLPELHAFPIQPPLAPPFGGQRSLLPVPGPTPRRGDQGAASKHEQLHPGLNCVAGVGGGQGACETLAPGGAGQARHMADSSNAVPHNLIQGGHVVRRLAWSPRS